MTTGAPPDVIVAVASAVVGGTLVQLARVGLDRRGARYKDRARAYRQLRALLRRYPNGPPQLAGQLQELETEQAFLDALAELAGLIADGWPSDGLTYTLQRLIDALARLPDHPHAAAETEHLYRVCSNSLVALDLGSVGVRRVGVSALPIVGTIVRSVREGRARRRLGKVLPPLPHGLPMPRVTSGPPRESSEP